jgi:glycosyltransferase involved in cell wall biosynthesis
MKTAPLVSVVTATHNRAARLSALFDALHAQTLASEAFEVVVVDDASSDRTRDVLEREERRGQLRMRTARHDQPKGPATARNRGWRLAEAPLIAFTDDDCVPTEGWLEALLAAAGDRPDAIVTGRTLPDPSESLALGPYAKTVSITGPSPHYETCNIAYPRALLERLGGFDETYPSPAGEDSDLGSRAIDVGGVPCFAPDALVHHAVFARGPIGALRDALLAAEGTQAYKRNPALRAHLALGVFYDRSHPLLVQAAVGAALARRNPHALVLALPYLWNVRNRCRASGGRITQATFYPVFDAVQIAATVRGAVRNRTFIL